MATPTNTTESSTISPLEALWALIQSQSKSVRRTLAKRLNASLETEKQQKVGMTEEEFYEKLDRSLESTKTGPVYTMGENESGEEFINRLLSGEK